MQKNSLIKFKKMTYSDKEKKTIAYLRSDNAEGYHFTEKADAWFRREIMFLAMLKKPLAWLNNIAEPELIPFLDKQPLTKRDAKKSCNPPSRWTIF